MKNKNKENMLFDKLQNFIRGFGTIRLLLQRAHKQGFLIEGMVLYASIVDGFCRICLVLKEQLEKKTNEINEKYIYQEKKDKGISERRIYKLAFERKIITRKIFNELNTLYDIRNKIIHRFITSEVEYSHLEVVCNRYEWLYEKLWKINYGLEAKQIKEGVGMTAKDKKLSKNDKLEIYKYISKKIKSGCERNLAKTLNCVSVEEVVEFGSKKGLFKICTCGHEKIHHIDLDILNKTNTLDLDIGLSKCSIKNCYCELYKYDKKVRYE